MARTKPHARPSRTSHAKPPASAEPGTTTPDTGQTTSKRKRPETETEDKEQNATQHQGKQSDTALPPTQASKTTKQNRPLPLNSPLRVPSNLQPVHRALGPHNWAEYLNLMLLFCRQEIGADEFVQRSGLVFKVDDKATRKRMLKLVMSEIVVPFMEEEEEKEEKRIEEARREQKRVRFEGTEE